MAGRPPSPWRHGEPFGILQALEERRTSTQNVPFIFSITNERLDVLRADSPGVPNKMAASGLVRVILKPAHEAEQRLE